ncbi:MAG: endolytic transglycosylase MltG [Clostridia bacterium]
MAFDFKKIKSGFKEVLEKCINGIKDFINYVKVKIEMNKQKKKASISKKPSGKRTTARKAYAESQKREAHEKEKKSVSKTTRTVKLRKSNMRLIGGRIFWLAFLVSLVILGIFCYRLTNDFIIDRNKTNIPELIGALDETNSFQINIPRGSRTSDIADILIENGIISDKKIMGYTYFELYSKLMGNDGGYKSGNHWINSSIEYDNPVGYDMLVFIFSQNPIPNPTATIFFAEGLTFNQTMKKFLDNEFFDAVRFKDVSNNYDFGYSFIDGIPQNNRYNRLEGYLFPDTYIFDKTKPEEEAIDKMLRNFEVKFKDIYIERLEVIGRTMDEIIIIASLIEKEAQIDTEREIIAGVIYNRLNTTDASLNYLQIDATIQYYFLNETGSVKEPLLTEDTLISSPYNTYKFPGLPPGPICNPGENSIIAALYPETHNYYYYGSRTRRHWLQW